MTKTVFSIEELGTFSRQVLVAAGMRQAHAQIVAETLVYADLRGVSSHGVARLSSYLDRVAAGVMAIDPEMHLSGNFPAMKLLDAENGFGQLAGHKAMEASIDMAGQFGVGAVSVRRSNHFGVAAYFVEMAARRGFVGMAMTNASPAMTPYNARTPLLGTNPIAFGIPAGAGEPIVLDMSSSLVARGKIRLASLSNQPIPLGWAVDANGEATTDAHAALKGTVSPMGGPKGAGLSLVIDLLSGVLSATALTGTVRNITDTSGPSQTGHLLMAINPSAVCDKEQFVADVAAITSHIRALDPVDGNRVYLPGEVEAEKSNRHKAEGIPMSEEVRQALDKLARQYDVTLD